MTRLLAILATIASLAGCAAPPSAITSPGDQREAADGYDLVVGEAFSTSDAQWAFKWRQLEGGIASFRKDRTSDGGVYLLTPVRGTDPKGRPVSYMCAVFLGGETPTPGPCEAEKAVETFAPIEVFDAAFETSVDGSRLVLVTIGVAPQSWLKIEPRVIRVVKYRQL